MNNYSSLYDLDELVLKCKNIEAQSYINEALICYKNRAYRASIVNLWIAIVYDFIRKIELLAANDVSKAKEFYRKFKSVHDRLHTESIYKDVLDFEKTVLDKVKELQLIDAYQYEDLSRLYNDRNRCAHPSFNQEKEPYQPSAEQVRLHLRNCIEYVLSRDLVQGKIATDLFERYVYSRELPNEFNALEKLFKNLEFHLIPKNTLVEIIQDVVFNKLNPNNLDFYKFHQNLILSLKVLLKLREEDVKPKLSVFLEKIIRISKEHEKRNAFILALSFPSLLDFSQEKNQLFKNEINSIISDDYNILNNELYKLCACNSEFSEKLIEKIKKSTEDELFEFARLYQQNDFYNIEENILTALKEATISQYQKQKNFYYANKVANVLLFLIKKLNITEQQRLIEIIIDKGNDQVRGSHCVHDIISELDKYGMLTSEHKLDDFIASSLRQNIE